MKEEKFIWIYDSKNIDWNELQNLYKIAPLGNKSANDLKTVFTNSRYKCFVFSGKKLVGAGRALADGIDCSYICDIAVHPNYQNKRIGTNIIKVLVDNSKEHRKIILYANPGKEPLYEKAGFSKMKTAMAIFKNKLQAQENNLIETKKIK